MKQFTNSMIPFSEVNKHLVHKIARYDPDFNLKEIIRTILYEMENNYASNKNYKLILHACKKINSFHEPFKKIKSEILFDYKISSKTLENKFNNFVGLPPSQYALTIKIREISETIYYKKIESYSTISYDYGFFDQSHFIHSFKSLVGTSPGKLLKEDFFIPKSDGRFRYYTI